LLILPDDDVMRSIASVALPITAPPSSALWVTLAATVLACLALWAFCITVLASCSIVADVSSIVAACLVVRSLRSLAPARISPVAFLRLREVSFSWPTIALSFSATALVSALRRANAP
jgi:hypothetical protein